MGEAHDIAPNRFIHTGQFHRQKNRPNGNFVATTTRAEERLLVRNCLASLW
jgi:hypothetical protein